MSIDLIVTRLIGQGEQGDKSPPLAPGASYALSQRLRDLVGAEAGGPHAADRGQAEEALRLAAYLDGTMDAAERTAYERELARSAARREELVGAAAWLDEIEARRQAPPAELSAFAVALGERNAAPVAASTWRERVAAWLERLFPTRRLAYATSALASVAILAVGLDIALHLSPRSTTTQQVVMAPTTAAHPPRVAERPWHEHPQAREADGRPMQYSMPPQGQVDVEFRPELLQALLAYRKDSSQPQRQQLLAALARAGLTAEDARRITTITVQPQLYEYADLGSASPVVRIAGRINPDGSLVLDVGQLR